jgi:hypothetical protein
VEAWAKRTKGITLSGDEADRLWQEATQPGGPPIELTALGHIRQMLRMLPEIFPYLVGRPWALVRFERRSLLTCDTSVALVPEAAAPSDEDVGLINAWGITFK